MRVVVDGLIYRDQSRGGISRLWNEILPRMCSIEPDLQVDLITHGRLRQPVPSHRGIRHLRLAPVDALARPYRLWWPLIPRARAAIQWQQLGAGEEAIWHSTYFTRPIRWRGAQVVTVCDLIYERFPELYASAADEWFRRQKRRCLEAADLVICISRATLDELRHHYPRLEARSLVVPLAASAAFALSPPAEPNGLSERPFLLYVGARSHHKNFKSLIEAYLRWPRRNDFDLVVVGEALDSGERRSFEIDAVAERVRCTGPVDDAKLCRLYNQAAVFVYPSLHEGFGVPLLEAMACGCPIVASKIPSTVEVAGDCPFYFEGGSVDGLIGALDAASAESRGSDRTRRGVERAAEYSWERTSRQTLDAYRSLARGRTGPGP